MVETNWRSTHLLNDTNDLVIVPNSTLAKATLTNLTGTDAVHGSKVVIRALPSRSPVTGLDGSAVEAEISFNVASLAQTGIAKNEIFDLVYRHAKAAGIQLSTSANALLEARRQRTPSIPERRGDC